MNIEDCSTLFKSWPASQLMTAINSLVYGIDCIFYDRSSKKMMKCQLSIHEEHINMIHIIIDSKASILFELQKIKSITDKDLFIKQTLAQLNMEHFIVIYTGALESYVLIMPSQNEKNVVWEGLQYFIHEAYNFVTRISQMDPFKTEATVLFLEADTDGSKLLDLSEISSIFKKLKINKHKLEIQSSILEINHDLYEAENLEKPKGFEKELLTPLGFEYLLRFYSMKASLAPIFTEFCPLFKFKHKKFKKTIVDILKQQNKPLMSGVQLQQLLLKYLKIKMTEEECIELIKLFPTYDGEGKEISEEVQLMSFHNFSSYVFNSSNNFMDPSKLQIYQNMDYPLNQYFVYSSSNTYLSGISTDSDPKLEMYELSLKKGCRCLEIDIQNMKNKIVVKHKNSRSYILLSDVLKTIKLTGFSINQFPIILSIENNCSSHYYEQIQKIFEAELGDCLYRMESDQSSKTLESPMNLKGKILLQNLNVDRKKMEGSQIGLYKLFSLTAVKLDFERKGLEYYNTCQIERKNILKYEENESKNLTDYCRSVIVRTRASQSSKELENYDPMPMFRNGVQLISFNMQKQDAHHYFMHSKFLENGGKNCGYLLKPTWLMGNCFSSLYATEFTKPIITIKMRILAGQKYVLKETNKQLFWLQVYLKGTKIEEEKNKKFVSEPKDEGFYADFELECEFVIYCVDLACFVFSIVDDEENILAYRAVSVKTIREGLRTLQLLGPGMEKKMTSCLLIYAQLFEQQKRKRKLSTIFS